MPPRWCLRRLRRHGPWWHDLPGQRVATNAVECSHGNISETYVHEVSMHPNHPNHPDGCWYCGRCRGMAGPWMVGKTTANLSTDPKRSLITQSSCSCESLTNNRGYSDIRRDPYASQILGHESHESTTKPMGAQRVQKPKPLCGRGGCKPMLVALRLGIASSTQTVATHTNSHTNRPVITTSLRK